MTFETLSLIFLLLFLWLADFDTQSTKHTDHRIYRELTGTVTHIVMVVVGGRGDWGGRGPRRDNSFTGTLQADREIPQHGSVGNWRQFMMTCYTHKDTHL